MKNTKYPLPKKYWLYLSLCAVFMVLLFVNIFVTDEITGDKPFSEYSNQELRGFAAFLLGELAIALMMFHFCLKACRLGIARRREMQLYFHEHAKFAGIEAGVYDYVWFDFSGHMRAKIIRQNDAYCLNLEKYNFNADLWEVVGTLSIFKTVDEIKKTLFYGHQFYCAENTAVDKEGKPIFRSDGEERRAP